MKGEVVWLDNSKRPGKPIRRRWRIYLGKTTIIVPLRTVQWSRKR